MADPNAPRRRDRTGPTPGAATGIRRQRVGRPLGDLAPTTDFARRLQTVCAGGTISEIAGLLGVKRDAARHYLTGARVPAADALASLVRGTRCNANWLLTGEGRPYADEAGRSGPEEPITVPGIGRAVGDARGGIAIDFDELGPPLAIPPETAVVRILGNSMAPVAYDGQLVFVDTREQPARDGDLVVVKARGRACFKRFYKEEEMVALLSVNPVEHQPPVRLAVRDIERLHVVRGVWFDEIGGPRS